MRAAEQTAARLAAAKPNERRLRSVPARHPPQGAWPGEMRADLAAAFLDFETTGKLFAAIMRGEAPRPTATRVRNGRREPVWSHEALRRHIARRHDIPDDGSVQTENIAGLI